MLPAELTQADRADAEAPSDEDAAAPASGQTPPQELPVR